MSMSRAMRYVLGEEEKGSLSESMKNGFESIFN